MDCLFCRIAAGDVPATIVHESDTLIAFHDIAPKAPHHLLIIPRKHIATINDVQPEDSELLGQMFLVAKQQAKQLGVAEAGYRVVMNCNAGGGQEIYHIHLHLLAGRAMQWPPG